jgi:hypothetical protein
MRLEAFTLTVTAPAAYRVPYHALGKLIIFQRQRRRCPAFSNLIAESCTLHHPVLLSRLPRPLDHPWQCHADDGRKVRTNGAKHGSRLETSTLMAAVTGLLTQPGAHLNLAVSTHLVFFSVSIFYIPATSLSSKITSIFTSFSNSYGGRTIPLSANPKRDSAYDIRPSIQ